MLVSTLHRGDVVHILTRKTFSIDNDMLALLWHGESRKHQNRSQAPSPDVLAQEFVACVSLNSTTVVKRALYLKNKRID